MLRIVRCDRQVLQALCRGQLQTRIGSSSSSMDGCTLEPPFKAFWAAVRAVSRAVSIQKVRTLSQFSHPGLFLRHRRLVIMEACFADFGNVSFVGSDGAAARTTVRELVPIGVSMPIVTAGIET